MAKKGKIRPIDTAPMGSTPIDIETFIAGIDLGMENGEFDNEIEQELMPSEDDEGLRRKDTIYDAFMDVFHQAADGWQQRSHKNGGTGSRFFLTIKPQAYNEGEYVALISMTLNYQSVTTGGQMVCEKKFGVRALDDLSRDDWKISLLGEMIIELFAITSLFIDAKKGVTKKENVIAQIREGEKKRKANK